MRTRPPPKLAEQQAVLAAIEEIEAQKAQLHAQGLTLRAELSRLWEGERSGYAEMELAGTALIGQVRASRELDDSTRLTGNFPRLAALLGEGLVFVPTAEELLRATRRCSPQVQAGVDARVADRLIGTNITDARQLIRHTILVVEAELDPELTRERLDQAQRDAQVWITPQADGTTAIGSTLDAVASRRWELDFEALVQAQVTLDKRTGTDRSIQQVRVEVFASLPSLVLELLRAARDGRLTELTQLDPETVAEVEQLAQDTRDLPLPDQPGEEPAEIRVEQDPYDPALAAQDPWADLDWEPVEPPTEDPPEPDPLPPWVGAGPGTRSGARGPDLRVLLRRCLQIPLPAPVTVNLHLPMATALELTDAPGSLDGHGPLHGRRIRQLLPDARLREVYVDPDSGIPLSAQASAQRPRPDQHHLPDLVRRLRPVTLIEEGEPQHDPSAALGSFVKLRDQRCTGPGCTMPASRSDLDHETPWPDGPTAEWNLSNRSRRCHGAKHHGWQATRQPDGSTDWTSPTERTYTSHSTWQPPPAIPKPTFQIHLPQQDVTIEIDTDHPA